MGGDGRRNAPRRAIQEVAGDRRARERLGSQAAADNAPPSQQLQARAAYASLAAGSTGIAWNRSSPCRRGGAVAPADDARRPPRTARPLKKNLTTATTRRSGVRPLTPAA